MSLHFSRLWKVKEGKLSEFLTWMHALEHERKEEALATFPFEGVTRETFVLFRAHDGAHYVIGCNEAASSPRPGDQSVPINQEHTSIKSACLEPVSERGEVLLDLSL